MTGRLSAGVAGSGRDDEGLIEDDEGLDRSSTTRLHQRTHLVGTGVVVGAASPAVRRIVSRAWRRSAVTNSAVPGPAEVKGWSRRQSPYGGCGGGVAQCLRQTPSAPGRAASGEAVAFQRHVCRRENGDNVYHVGEPGLESLKIDCLADNAGGVVPETLIEVRHQRHLYGHW